MKIVYRGFKVGKLTVIGLSSKITKYNVPYWKVRCECGNEKEIWQTSLTRTNPTKSCGCIKIERGRTFNRLTGNQSSKNRLITSYRKRSKNKGIEFNLTEEEFFDIIVKDCHYCKVQAYTNTKTINKNGVEHFYYSGLDRVNPFGNYDRFHVVPCCIQCNRAKHVQSYEEFLNYIKRLEGGYH